MFVSLDLGFARYWSWSCLGLLFILGLVLSCCQLILVLALFFLVFLLFGIGLDCVLVLRGISLGLVLVSVYIGFDLGWCCLFLC